MTCIVLKLVTGTIFAFFLGLFAVNEVAFAQPSMLKGSGIIWLPGTNDPTTASGKKELEFYFEMSITDAIDENGDPCQVMGIWLRFRNTRYAESFHFHVCSMFSFEMPLDEEIETYRNRETDDWERYCQWGPSYRIVKVDDEYICEQTGTNAPKAPYVNLHFGCREVTIGSNNSLGQFAWAIDIPNLKLPDITCIQNPEFGEYNDFQNIKLSAEAQDDDAMTWNLVDLYIDVLDGACEMTSSCSFNGLATNFYLSPGTLESDGFANAWAATPQAIKKKDEPDPVSTGVIEVGNWSTMDTPGNYPVRLLGRLTGAPSGSVLTIRYPANLPGTDSTIIYDDTTYVVDTLSNCVGDTVSIDFDFMITPYPEALMTFDFSLPNSDCGDSIENGDVVQFMGNVFTRDTFLIYDSAAVLYGVNIPYLCDTTAPSIDSISTTVLDSNSVIVYVSGVEDASMVVGAWLVYQVNGGDDRYFFLGFEDSVLSDGQTGFYDTLNVDEDSALVTFIAVIRNTFNMQDTSGIDSCWLYSIGPPLSVRAEATQRELSLSCIPNPASGNINISIRLPESAHVAVELYDSRGKHVRDFLDVDLPAGPHSYGFDVSDVPDGLYFCLLKAGDRQVTSSLNILHGNGTTD